MLPNLKLIATIRNSSILILVSWVMVHGWQPALQCNQAREQNFFISEFEPILTHKIKSIIDKSLKLGTNLLQHKLYIEFKLWDVTVIISIFMASA